MLITTPANPKLRYLRANRLIWSTIFLGLAGPFNPAAWLAWVVVDGELSENSFRLLAWTVLMPSSVIAMIVLGSILRRPLFSGSYLWRSALIGLGFGILAGPLGVILGGPGDLPSLIEMVQAIFLLLIFGTMIGVVPYFAVVFGIPCMFAAVAIGYLCSEPVD